MIIKKSKNRKNPEENNEQNAVPLQNETVPAQSAFGSLGGFDEAFETMAERQERRRGDRRRGYRRVDDRNLISRAQEEANTIKERAAKEGFQLGINHSQTELSNLNSAIDALMNAREYSLEVLTQDIAFIALKVAEKIIKTEVACDETIVLNIISEVLKEVGKGEKSIIIKTNPADTEYVRNNAPNLMPYSGKEISISVIPDSEVEWGSCIVETNNGIVDANFSTQFETILKAFNEGM